MLQRMARRGALAGLATCWAAGGVWAAPTSLPDQPNLLVAGPAGGRADRWAALIAPALGRELQQGGALPRQNVGGPDGVTGANQFEARTAPDGGTALLVPGLAALSWLGGDTRVRFDAARWVPVWTGSTSAALASRVRLVPGRRLRVAVASLIGPELAALLALDLMGIDVTPVRVEPDAAQALNRTDVDAVYLSGPVLRTQAPRLAQRGWGLALGFGVSDAAGDPVRDPAFPDLPIAQELIGAARTDAPHELMTALRAVTAASQLDLALVLPQLSPATIVAWWRRGCGSMAQAPDIQSEAARSLVRPSSPQVVGATITVDVPVLLQLRRWLAERYQWRPA